MSNNFWHPGIRKWPSGSANNNQCYFKWWLIHFRTITRQPIIHETYFIHLNKFARKFCDIILQYFSEISKLRIIFNRTKNNEILQWDNANNTKHTATVHVHVPLFNNLISGHINGRKQRNSSLTVFLCENPWSISLGSGPLMPVKSEEVYRHNRDDNAFEYQLSQASEREWSANDTPVL